jgi:hypothetical protein
MQILDWKQLLSADFPWVHMVYCPEREVDNFSLSVPPGNGVVVRIIRGKRCNTIKGLFQEWAAALQFPYYFGENWGAFDECINDLEWLPANSYVIFVTHIDCVLPDSEKDFRIFIEILKDSASERRNSTELTTQSGRIITPFHIIFHSEPGNKNNAMTRLKQAGLDIVRKEARVPGLDNS